MAFTVRNLGVLSYTNGFTLWDYLAEADDVNTVAGPGYFNNAADMLAVGDRIMVRAVDGGVDLYVAEIEPLRLVVFAQAKVVTGAVE
jgi:hypothetical protein